MILSVCRGALEALKIHIQHAVSVFFVYKDYRASVIRTFFFSSLVSFYQVVISGWPPEVLA